MRYNHIFNAVKERLITIEQLKLVTWYNNQGSDAIIHAVPAAYISFPDVLEAETLNNQNQHAPITIRVHLYSKLHTNKDGSIRGSNMVTHETLAGLIFDALQSWSLDDKGEPVLNSMMRTRMELDMNEPGWAITTQDFECMVYQLPVTPDYTLQDKPPLGVVEWP